MRSECDRLGLGSGESKAEVDVQVNKGESLILAMWNMLGTSRKMSTTVTQTHGMSFGVGQYGRPCTRAQRKRKPNAAGTSIDQTWWLFLLRRIL